MSAARIDPSQLAQTGELLRRAARGAEPGGPGFKETLKNYLDEVNDLQRDADKALADLATGKVDNLHEVIVAMSEADLSFRLMMEVRNRLLSAYQEIMRMQV